MNEKLDVDDRALTYRLAANVFKRSNEIQEKVKGLVALVHLAALQESQQMWEQSNNTLRQLRDMFASAPDAGKAAPDWVVEYASRGIPDEEPSQHELKQMLFICNEYSDRQRATARRLDTEEAWQSYASSIHRVAFGLETVSSDNREAATRLHQQGCAIRRTLVERFNTPEAMKLLLSSLLFHHNNAAKDTTERIDLLKEELAVARTMEEKFPNKGLASVADVLLNLTLAYKELQNVSAATRYLSELEHVMCELEDKDPGSLRDSMFGDPTLLLVDFTEVQRQLRAPPT